MQAFIGITDWDWFQYLRRRPDLDEVNFWQPSGSTGFSALRPGEPFLFKLHSPRDAATRVGLLGVLGLNDEFAATRIALPGPMEPPA